MDASNFSVQLDLAGSGLIKTIEGQLLQSEVDHKHIRAELYKLNVYGKSCREIPPTVILSDITIHPDKGAFFKAHRDTPRGTKMFGSLVVVYPTPHEGGELVLRHRNHEWKFDANLLTASLSSPSLAYIAFYSDIEHEVLKVTSGHRVTITYNLYLVNPESDPGAPAITPNVKDASNLQTTLGGLLKSPEFLPDGGTLGFGLVHLYPVTTRTCLQDMASYLKGEDAHVYQACRELQLQPSLQMIYDAEAQRKYGIMLDRIVSSPDYDCHQGETYGGALVADFGGVFVNKYGDTDSRHSKLTRYEHDDETEYITWVSLFDSRNQLQDISMGYGNEVSAEYIYCSPCIIVRIAAASDRV